jgi:uncharacterized protein YdeI (YjbR/CyaY-like superfamily)
VENFDKRIDVYITKAEPFARPILEHLRFLVHKACPEVEETMKWSFPHFQYKGILCSMASFKNHCAFGFWKASLMKDPHNIMSVTGRTSMGHFNKITSADDLPPDKFLLQYIKEAKKLNDDEVKIPAKKKAKETAHVKVPDFFLRILNKNTFAKRAFESFSNSHRKEYVQWITEAKTESTRNKRIATAIAWLEEGKPRHWQYAKK